ncbi:TatD family hydrolase [Parvularcula flava]|uniref:LuxR family transcriptional regulator n=1 Tax=Aquisalinus luteolus TaxID=1566827 RepID=A0A8J3A1H9_9PROT|nr:TatD family hydrolase [Aquisalinus luteolus]NHK27643.1 TatD family hydrolase [Aquisalinus luteolus]GGH96062.1 LuxR family transcriptional regulator [Aquisalinus luteolus]
MFVDSHVNLHGEKYEDDLADVLARAAEARVSHMLTISDRLHSLPAITAISEAHANIWHSVGVHPHHAKDYADLTAERLIELAQHSRAVGIGECGMDFYYEYSDREAQEPVFRAHVHAAQETGLPLIIHTRNADDVTGDIISGEHAAKPFIPLMHCYTSGPELAEKALSLGGYVSFSGIITFKKADDVRAIAEMVPLDRLLIETDCPYLSPVPHRGQRNEPSFVPHVAEKLAEIKGVDTDELARVTTENFFRLFSKAQMEQGA